MSNQTTTIKRPIQEALKDIHTFGDFKRIERTIDNTDYYTERNQAINTERKEQADLDLMDNIAIRATWSTLQFLIGQGATIEQATESTDQPKEEKAPYGYNMALKLLQGLPNDLAIMRTGNTDQAYLDSIDLIQEIRQALTPFICSDIIIEENTIVYTKQLKNGSVKDYTLFKLACNTIRKYIQAQGQKQYKKLAYVIGMKDNNEPVYSTKRPVDTMEDLTDQKRKTLLSKYNLTAQEQKIMLHYINGLKPVDIAPLVNMTFEATKKALYRAKQTIKAAEKPNKMIID